MAESKEIQQRRPGQVAKAQQGQGAMQTQAIDDRPSVLPPVDVYENSDEYLVRADLPGARPDSIDIQYERGELSLHAERDEMTEGEQVGVIEFGPVVFKRSFRIPEQIQSDAITADYRNGVLELRLPKSPEVRPRRIEIRS